MNASDLERRVAWLEARVRELERRLEEAERDASQNTTTAKALGG